MATKSMTDLELLREWSAARAKGMCGIDTECNYLQEHLLGEEVICEYCCEDGDRHHYRRSIDFDAVLGTYCAEKASPAMLAGLGPFPTDLRESMQLDLKEWLKGNKDRSTADTPHALEDE